MTLAGERHGELVDFFGGRKDIQRKEIRVLHSLCFIDDPTRAIRAIRYARRLGFAVAPDTQNLIATAVRERVFDRLSGQRLRREIEHLLEQTHPTPSLSLLAELGLLSVIVPDLHWSEELRSFLLEVEGQLAWHELERLGPPPESWFLFLGALVVRAPQLPLLPHYHVVSWPEGAPPPSPGDIDEMWRVAHALARSLGERLFSDEQCFSELYNGARTRSSSALPAGLIAGPAR